MPHATILLVDDNESFLSGLAELLRAGNLEVVTRSDFITARDYLAQHVPDVLVSDVRLRQYNGLHLVLTARARSPKVLAVVYSSHRDPFIESEAAQCGAVFIDKYQIGSELLRLLARHQRDAVGVARSDDTADRTDASS